MNIQENVPFKDLTTMGLGGNAKFVQEIHSSQEAAEACKNAQEKNLPIFIIGDGSNIIAHDEGFNGVIIKIKIPGFEVISNDGNLTLIKIGAGENWDLVVKRAVDMNLCGIEAMSWIPGTAGAAPIQNTGAYGQEIADVLVSVEAYDMKNDCFVTLQKSDCQFGYRASIFKDREAGRYIITSITIRLSKESPKPPFYDSLQKYFDENYITSFTPQLIRDTVIKMRQEKLPDPKTKPNSGSFFKNTIVSSNQLEKLKEEFPNIPSYSAENNEFKIPTGWLIDQSGLKGKLIHGMRVHDKNALILINESAQSYQDLADARNEIIKTVYDVFELQIAQEPLEI